MDRAAPELAHAFRRAVPFLTKRRIRLVPGPAQLVRSDELPADLTPPVYVAHLASEPGGARAALLVDGPAVAFLLDGTLGGDCSRPPALPSAKLSGPLAAFMARICQQAALSLSDALAATVGLKLRPLPGPSGERSTTGSLIALPLEFAPPAGAEQPEDEPAQRKNGRVVFAISKSALEGAQTERRTPRAHRPDPRLTYVVGEAEIELTAELGRMRLCLSRLAALRPGDVLQLDVPLGSPVEVRVRDVVVLRGLPTAVGAHVGVRLVSRASDLGPAATHAEPKPGPR